jgi:hypothetical protein
LLIVWAFACSASLAQTNAFITFTNRDGSVVRNAEVVKIFPNNKLIWEQNPCTISEISGVVKLADLPPDSTSEAFRKMSCRTLHVHRMTVSRDSAQPSARFWRAAKTLLK